MERGEDGQGRQEETVRRDAGEGGADRGDKKRLLGEVERGGERHAGEERTVRTSIGW